MTSESHRSAFNPRPVAREMTWSELLPPTRVAVSELLVRLAAAPVVLGGASGAERATRLLVDGERGTGKTTVCMSARFATQSPGAFFGSAYADAGARSGLSRDLLAAIDAVRKCAGHLRWLDTLDLEPLPRSANLLAALLVRIRAAVEGVEVDKRGSSLLGAADDECLDDIDRLVSDAPLVWEDFAVTDDRDRTRTKTLAAENYLRFPDQFRKAVGKVSRRVAAPGASGMVLVLPIDNMDRSTEHVQSIFKLAQMVACPELWLILAGDRVDSQLFLERAYWRELGSGGRPGPDGEDEALGIARRQAAATQRKVLPPAHRVRVEPVAPEEALAFRPSGGSDFTLQDLLEGTRLGGRGAPHGPRKAPERLIDLFDIAEQVPPEPGHSHRFTFAGWHALTLPARSLLDLWQRASEVFGKPDAAPRIACLMLRHAIAESSLSDEVSKILQDRVILDSEGTVLDFSAASMRPVRTVLEGFQLEIPATAPVGRMRISLDRLKDLGTKVRLRHQGRPTHWKELAGNVSGWISVLLDLLIVVPDPEMFVVELNLDAPTLNPDIVDTLIDAVVEGQPETLLTTWPTPAFETMTDLEIFVQQWDRFLDEMRQVFDPKAKRVQATDVARILVSAWIENGCSVSGPERGHWDGARAAALCTGDAVEIQAYERRVASHAAKLYEDALQYREALYEHLWADVLCEWLEVGVPMLGYPEIMGKAAASSTLWSALQPSRLGAWWDERRDYLDSLRSEHASDSDRKILEALDKAFLNARPYRDRSKASRER
jgi:hypothetical protein